MVKTVMRKGILRMICQYILGKQMALKTSNKNRKKIIRFKADEDSYKTKD